MAAATRAEAVTHPGQVTLGRGVVTWRQNFTTARRYAERAVLMQIELTTRGACIHAASPHDVLGASRATVGAQADGSHAVGGVNADFSPAGGRRRHRVRSPHDHRDPPEGDPAGPPDRAQIRAQVACGRKAPAWLDTELAPGDPVSVSLAFPPGRPRVAVSGGRVLVYRGRAYTDVGGQVLRNRTNPETFACVPRTGASVLLGVVDGRSTRSRGVDYPELTAYMIILPCYVGMTFDGGGSATMVGRLPRHPTASALNVPSDDTLRPVSDSLLAYPR